MEKLLIVGGTGDLGARLCERLSGFELHATFHKARPSQHIAHWHHLDLSKPGSFGDFARNFAKNGTRFNYALFIAAATPNANSFEPGVTFTNHLSPEKFSHYFMINAAAPVLIFESLFIEGALCENSTVIFFSSKAGSTSLRGRMAHNIPGGNMIYRASKAALNCCIKNMAFDLEKHPITLIALHPGWSKTESGGKAADLSVTDAVEKIRNVILSPTSEYHGKFISSDYEELDW